MEKKNDRKTAIIITYIMSYEGRRPFEKNELTTKMSQVEHKYEKCKLNASY